MNSAKHAALGAGLAVLPDIFLALYGWRRRWLPADHPLVRAHGLMHSPVGIALVCCGSHVVADRFSKHRTGPPAGR